jgi:uncharacterized damage-inducible protein DinB
MAMASDLDLKSAILDAWTTTNRVTEYLIERIPPDVWSASAPAGKHRSVRSIAAHLHNSRRMWIGTLGREHGITVPARVDERTVTRKKVLAALKRSNRGMVSLLTLGVERGGRIPATAAYVWRNLPLDVGHVLAYFVAHEGHHRGQIVMLARQMGHRLPVEVTGGLWQWTRRSAEVR